MNRADDIRDNEPDDAGKRRFLQLAGSGIAGLGLAGASMNAGTGDDTIDAVSNLDAGRRTQAWQKRMAAARAQKIAFEFEQTTNGDETAVPNYAVCYSKGLPHNDLGEVDPTAYKALLKATRSGKGLDVAAVPMGTASAKLVNPCAGFNFTLFGPDAQGLTIPPPPAFSSAEIGAEMAEAYWAALIRDVPFAEDDGNAALAVAATDLAKHPGYHGPAAPNPGNLFRAALPGVLDGPWLSQSTSSMNSNRCTRTLSPASSSAASTAARSRCDLRWHKPSPSRAGLVFSGCTRRTSPIHSFDDPIH